MEVEKSDKKTLEVHSATHRVVSDTVELRVVFGTKNIDEYWNKGEYGLALLIAAIDVENILFDRLSDTLASIKSADKESIIKQVNKFTLGTYKKWCTLLGLFDKSELEKLKDLVEERNNIVHVNGYIRRATQDKALKDRWKGIIEKAKKFIQLYGEVERTKQ